MTSFRFRTFLFFKLPSAFWAGIKLHTFCDTSCQTKVRLNGFTKNPFRSMFWAIQGMAAELSTGVLCLSAIEQSGKNISMLVTQQEAVFHKKAVGTIYFECREGKEIQDCINKSIAENKAQTIKVKSIGKDESGETVSEFEFTWSFKTKKPLHK